MKINYYLRDKAPGKNCALRVYVTINGKRERIPTNFHSTPENWNTKRQEPRESHPEYDDIIAAQGIFNSEIRNYFRTIPPPHSRQGLLDYLHFGPKPVLLHDLAKEHYIKPHKKKGTLDYYQDFINHLRANTSNISIHDIDMSFWEDYTTQLLKLAHSTRTQYQRHVKAILNSALKSGLTKNAAFVHFKVSQVNQKKENKPRITFTKEEIAALESLQLKTESRNEMRDKICLFCYLGLRVSDWEIQREDIDFEKNVIMALTQKSTTRVALPIFPQAHRILNRYDYTIAPKKYGQKRNAFLQVLKEAKDHIPSLRRKYKLTDVQGNLHTLEKWQLLRPHDIRRTYCTWLYKDKAKLGLSEREIMMLSGHTSLKEFLKYINLSNEEVADKVNLRIAEMASVGHQF